jgi:hypothetical protein
VSRSETINEDGTPVLIEAVYYRRFEIYVEEYDSVEEAQAALTNGEEYNALSSVGVYVEGKPHSCGPWDWHAPVPGGKDRSLEYMVEQYEKAKPSKPCELPEGT